MSAACGRWRNEDGFDLAIRNGPLGGGAGLATRRIAHQRMTVCAAPSYRAAHGTPRTIEGLRDHETVTYERAGHVRAWLFPQGAAPPVEFVPRTRLRFDDLEAIADVAVAGVGLAWLPCWLIRDRVRSGDLVRVLGDNPGLVFDCHALWPQTPHLPMRVRLAIDALAVARCDRVVTSVPQG
jgi:DNA-binding transcriptional LysR family regulator